MFYLDLLLSFIIIDKRQPLYEETLKYEVLEDILNDTPEVAKDFVVFLETLDSSSINIKVHAYVKTKVFNKFVKEREKFILEAVRRFREEGIEFAFPSQTVYIAKDNNEN